MSLQNILGFLVMAILVTLSPGPDILTVITRSVTQGTWAGIVATLGFATGLIVHTTVAATGLAIVLHESKVAFHVIQLLGAGYLVYLAVRMFMANDPLMPAEGMPEKRHLLSIYRQSILMNVLNPKVTLFFVAFLSKFCEPQGRLPFAAQMVVLGGLFALCTVVCFGTCALLAGRLADGLRRHPHAGRPLRWAAALVFVIVAALLVLE